MVFNPNLEGGVRFEQPVQQPQSPITGIIQGLGVFNRRESPSPTAGDRYDAAVNAFREETGAPGVSSWTESTRRQFASAFPQFADRPYGTANEALDLEADQQRNLELMGGGADAVSQRARRDNYVEWVEGPMGISATNTGNIMFDGDPAQVEAYVAEQYALNMMTQGEALRIASDTELMANSAAYSQTAWDTYEDQFYAVSINAVNTVAPHLRRIAAGQTIQYSEIEGFAEIMGSDGTINANNIGTVFAQYRSVLVQQMTSMMRTSPIAQAAGAPRIQQPDPEYINAIMAPIDRLVEAFQSEDVNAALDRATSAANLRLMDRLSPSDREGLALLDRLSGNPIATERVMLAMEAGGFSGRLLEALSGAANGDPTAALTPEEAADMGAQEAADYVETATVALYTMIEGGATTEEIQGMLTTITNANSRANSEIDPSVYRGLFTPQAVDAISGSREATTAFSQFIQADIANDWDDLRQMVEGEFGSVSFADGQLTYTPVSRSGDDGGSLGMSQLSGDARALMESINEKLGIVQSTGIGEVFGPEPEAFFGAITTGMEASGGSGDAFEGEEAALNRGADRAALRRQIIESVPSGAVQLGETSWATPGMNPLVGSLDGASSMTRTYAPQVLQSVLEGPFADLQERFGRALTINDAIARDGTSRETETPGSQHFQGTAIDVSISGMSDEDQLRLVQEALASGFQGFGLGTGIIHLDMGSARSWDYDNSTFGGLPVSEVQQMIASGVIDPSMASRPVVHPSTLARLDTTGLGYSEEEQNEYDGGEGLSQNMLYVAQEGGDLNTVEQEPVGELGQTIVEQEENSSRVSREPNPSNRTPQTIEALIEELTGEIDTLSEEEREEIRTDLARRLGLAPQQRPAGVEREAFSQREGR